MERLSNNEVKLFRQLRHKKFRDESGLFVAEGSKLISDLQHKYQLHRYIDQNNATSTQIEQISTMQTPQGQIGIFRISDVRLPAKASQDNITLVLDDIQDPGNLGTIIRTAAWFGVKDIVCSMHTADCYNPKVVQSTMGALAHVNIYYTDIYQWLRQQDLPIYGTLLTGKNMYQTATITPSIIVMGNEGNGISEAVRTLITHPILIPSYPENNKAAESLNVGIATAITLAQFRNGRQVGGQ